MLLGYGYIRNNLVRLGGYPTHRNLANISFFFYFCFVFIYDQAEWRAYRDLAFRSRMRSTKIDINTSASLSRRKLWECVCTNLDLQNVKVIFITWLWARLVWRDGTDFTHTQKYIIPLTEPARLSGYFFHINIQPVTNTSP